MNDHTTTPADAPGTSPTGQEAPGALTAEARLQELEAKHTDMSDAYLRAKAEAENTRRRAEDEIAKARKYAVEGFAESLLPVKDSLEAAIALPDATPEQMLEGVHATLRQLVAALERNKVLESTPAPDARSTRTSTRPSAWCRRRRNPTPWSRCCKKVIRSPTGCCVRRS